MKHYVKQVRLFTLSLGVVFALSAHALAADLSGDLNRMEQQLFTRTYPADSVDARLGRIESTVFGASKNDQPQAQRLQDLGQFFQFPQQAPATAQRPAPSAPPSYQQTPAPDVVTYQPNQPVAPNTTSVSGSESEYPSVLAMEQRLFSKTYPTEPIESRLARIENRVLGSTQAGSLQERTDQLRLMVLGDTGSGGSEAMANDNSYSSASAPSGSVSAAASADMIQALPKVEKRILGRNYTGDTVENRLSRIETKLFNSTAPEMSPDDRFYRIVSVANAQRSGQMEQAYRRAPIGVGVGPYGRYGYGTGYRMNSGFGVGGWGTLLQILLNFI